MKRIIVCCILSALALTASANRLSASKLPSVQEEFYKEVERDMREVADVTSKLPDQPASRQWRDEFLQLEAYLRKELPKLKGKTINAVLQRHDLFDEEERHPAT